VLHVDPTQDSLEAFGSEAALAPASRGPDRPHLVEVRREPPTEKAADERRWDVLAVAGKWAAVVVLSAAAAGAAVWQSQRTIAPITGTLTLETSPPGLAVSIDGKAAGSTPLTLTLAPASYAVQVGDGAERRDLTVSLAAGSAVIRHLEMPAPTARVAATAGALHVQTDPARQSVSVDGVERGVSPLVIDSLAAGAHSVVVKGARGSVRRTVHVKAGETVSLVVSAVESAVAAPGWLSVTAPVRLELREAGKLIGTTETEQLMLAAGEHPLEIVSEALGYRSVRTIEVASGKTTAITVDLPLGSVSLNAQPWAEVWLDGERIGETPIANLARRIGPHEVLFRHPQLGERRETIVVSLKQPVRLGVDMRGKQP
jgi:hypothetical protein